MSLRVLLVTSRVTFVPENYNQLVCGLASTPHVVGCVVIDNREWKMVLQGLALLLTGAAPRMGLQLLTNFFGDLMKHKRQAYEGSGKLFLVVKDLNAAAVQSVLLRERIDLIVNARTRTIFKKQLLETPRLGCINIHHGLLPNQRGLMCDFWSHLENTSTGFSIHQMTPKLDDGNILSVVEVPSDKTDYMKSIYEGSKLEVQATKEVIADIASSGTIAGFKNEKTEQTIYRKNPGIVDFFKLKFKGVKI
ncbi:formyltransferase family protein [Bdellovibrio sp. HCB337]|uniref:formyltransferase family protein n=1 Tax=Bdellovibrio sp. HCB337 TaxID=3394358 RepID=UPI0039A52183